MLPFQIYRLPIPWHLCTSLQLEKQNLEPSADGKPNGPAPEKDETSVAKKIIIIK